jgi:hypothetical protein
MSKMKIGYLHIDPDKHGVCRYGRILAAEARRRPDVTVIEADVILTENRKHNRELLAFGGSAPFGGGSYSLAVL